MSLPTDIAPPSPSPRAPAGPGPSWLPPSPVTPARILLLAVLAAVVMAQVIAMANLAQGQVRRAHDFYAQQHQQSPQPSPVHREADRPSTAAASDVSGHPAAGGAVLTVGYAPVR